MEELWQLFDDEGNAIKAAGATKDEVYTKGLLHGASHVWIWRNVKGNVEVLLQKRSAMKRTWPNLLDISAAGHIDIGETPVDAAIRETQEEIGLKVTADDLQEIKIHKTYITTENGDIENEFQWIYLHKKFKNSDFALQEEEVGSLVWVALGNFENECNSGLYVPHGEDYFSAVISAIKIASVST